jgi:Fur family ferric uptake transcriptional regulator
MTSLEQLQKTLKQHGRSMTAARRGVFTALAGQEPMTMHSVVARCASIDRASVYRTISLFEQLGIVQRLQTGWKYRLELSDAFHTHHHHATCIRCGRTIALAEHAEVEKLLAQLAKQIDFTLQRHQLELQGLCTACAATSHR